MTISFDCREGEDAVNSLAAFLPVYAEAYAEPPYCETPKDVEEFAHGWCRRASSPGFRLVLATDNSETVGFTFGHGLPEETTWWDGALDPLPRVATHEWHGRTFAIIELAVRRPWRRQGIARRLHDLLIDGAGTTERLTLLVRPEPEARPAQQAYATWGYQNVGRIRPGAGFPTYNALVRPRHPGA